MLNVFPKKALGHTLSRHQPFFCATHSFRWSDSACVSKNALYTPTRGLDAIELQSHKIQQLWEKQSAGSVM